MASSLCKNCAVAGDINWLGRRKGAPPMTRSGDEDCLNELLYEIETNPERKSRITFSKSIDVQTGFQR